MKGFLISMTLITEVILLTFLLDFSNFFLSDSYISADNLRLILLPCLVINRFLSILPSCIFISLSHSPFTAHIWFETEAIWLVPLWSAGRIMKFKPCMQSQSGSFRPDKQRKKQTSRPLWWLCAQSGQANMSGVTGSNLLTLLAQ